MDDPGQFLTMQAVAAHGQFVVRHGAPGRFLAGIRTWLRHRPHYLHFDWIEEYFIGRNVALTLARTSTLVLDILVLRWIFRCRIAWTLHNLRAHERWCPEAIELWVQRFMAGQCEWIRVFSHSSVPKAAERLGVPATKLCVLPEASFVGYYPDTIDAESARERLGLPSDAFVILWLGSLRPYKGVEDLIDSFIRVARPHWRLVVAGRPAAPQYAERLAMAATRDRRILFRAGFVPDVDLQLYYRSCNVVVLPFAEVENSGSLLVAMGFGRPVIAPRIGVVVERLTTQAELTYEPGSCLEEVLEAAARMDPTRLEALGRQNREDVQRNRWQDVVQLFLRGRSSGS